MSKKATINPKEIVEDLCRQRDEKLSRLYDELLEDPHPDNLDLLGELQRQGLLVLEDERYHDGFADGCAWAIEALKTAFGVPGGGEVAG